MSILFIHSDKNAALEEISARFAVDTGTSSPDVVILQTEELKIGIDQIRDLKKQLNIRSVTNQKLAIILETEKLTVEAQNALLKTLEEPPDGVHLFLQARNTHQLLPTILSRCQIINLSPSKKPSDQKPDQQSTQVLQLIESLNIKGGFAWAKNQKDRVTAIATIDQLLATLHQTSPLNPKTARKLLKAKKYLQANTNVRLTLENLFLD